MCNTCCCVIVARFPPPPLKFASRAWLVLQSCQYIINIPGPVRAYRQSLRKMPVCMLSRALKLDYFLSSGERQLPGITGFHFRG